ncbi:methyltransferase [Sparassis latifolia]
MQSEHAGSGSSRIPKTTSSVHGVKAENPPFGSRFLTEEADVWSQNAWDHVPPPEGQQEVIAAALARQKISPVPDTEKSKYNDRPSRHWDNFYKMNSGNFFRNRKWLHLEFPELVEAADAEAGSMTVAEIGCGAGNAVFPLLSANSNPQLVLLAFDYSSHAVKLVQTNPLYVDPPVGQISAAVWDLSSPALPRGVEPESIDIIILVFVLSALHPNEWSCAISNIYEMLKPGGLILFRDYGRHDLAQLRFKGGRLLDDNFYVRGDKTRVYFFEIDELALLFTGSLAPQSAKANKGVKIIEDNDDNDDLDTPPAHSGAPLPPVSFPSTSPVLESAVEGGSISAEEQRARFLSPTAFIHPSLIPAPAANDRLARHPLFAIEQLGVDRRLIVNRKRQLKMYRVWMQGKFRKLER